MAILNHEQIKSNTGFAKEIEESAMTMIFDNLQRSQYSKPIQSTVREIACNALDSVKERDVAKAILTGKKKEEDYFIRRDEAIYKDSNFDSSYYDLQHLSDKSKILISYHSNGTTGEKDFISIKDWGVGLGGSRLQNSIKKLGWSTKRNAKLTIGKFGIGAKAPLSTGVTSYRTISVYNGKRFIFDIFSHKFESVVPKFNLENKTENKFEVWQGKSTDGKISKQKVYYEDTKDKNSVEIIVTTKKHHKQLYIDAIKSQLLYLKGIEFIVNEDGIEREIQVTSNVLYEDDKIILADNNQYSKPHIVIDNVNYGYVDFQELELEQKIGNVGIKVGAEEVSVTPSRESVIWNEQTRETVVNRFHEVTGIAAKFVEESLDEKDFFTWIQKCVTTISSTGRNSVLGRLSQLVDKDSINPSFPGNKKIKYKGFVNFFFGFRARYIGKEWDKSKGVNVIKRIENVSWSRFDPTNIYIQNKTTSHIKDLYLYSLITENSSKNHYNTKTLILQPLNPPDSLLPKKKKEYITYQNHILTELKNLPSYDDVVIPEEWKDRLKAMEKAEETGDNYNTPTLTPAERRKAEQKTVYKYPEKGNSYWDTSTILKVDEWRIKDIDTITENPNIKQVIYGFQEDRKLIDFIFKETVTTGYKLISISKQNEKYYKGKKNIVYIKDIFKQIDTNNKIITVNDLIKKYNTARLISNEISKLNFLCNFDSIDTEISDKWKKVDTFYQKCSRNGDRSAAIPEIDSYLDKIVEFQLFVNEAGSNNQVIADKSLELFGTKEFKNAYVIDFDVYKKYKELLSYAEPIGTLLNEVDPLITSKKISQELELEIKTYIKFKLNME